MTGRKSVVGMVVMTVRGKDTLLSRLDFHFLRLFIASFVSRKLRK